MPKSTKVAKTEEEIRLYEKLEKRRQKRREYEKGYRQKENGKAATRKAQKNYSKTKKGKATQTRYNASKKGKAVLKRYNQQPHVKITKNLRRRVYHALKSQPATKSASTMDLIGCSVEEFKKHIQSQFTEGMSWENRGVQRIGGEKRWHFDHIRPCSSFDLNDPEQQKMCFHYMNQQPLWAKENWRKGAKLPATN